MFRATITDIARELGLSASTVSRALHDHPDISEATKTKVKEIAARLDYFPDSIAQGFKKQRTSTIGIIVPEIQHHFFSSAISGIEDLAYNAGFTIMVCQSNEDYEREKLNLRAMVSNRVAGLLVSLSQSTMDVSHFDILKKRKIPVVFFDRTHEDLTGSQVKVDDHNGAYQLVSHLIDRGYKHIAHIAGPSNILIGRERECGYRDALIDRGLTIDESLIVRGGYRNSDGTHGAEKLLALPKRPDAIFCVNDPVALGAYLVIKQQGLRIPNDIALAGFSNNPISALIEPPLTTVDQMSYDIGKSAAALLLEQIEKGVDNVSPVILVKKTKLIIRKST
ncbi:LacI family DNA-binding transcriptional regulator [Desulfopila aestuarii]|uniref:Transcriptional regulator, LacI family n=1 Tax=Desulfopila aestuarii DSM 18488 TaxID=1121416 RepID=A0A1M7XXH8_9BACT|nr:LacI family DNA-binding transcriptional regulator [Desulfopila aestuarii]SHO43484.1 transcriptional regulator, LacI family [Desulfopila aestuarii DSM 18488]